MTATAPSPLQLGDVLLGKYRVERVLGKGGMGMVLAVRHLTLGELFAVKVMLPEMLTNPLAVRRFLREAQASARLRGEHVARVHDVGTFENGVPYMVLEYLEGSDLDRLLVSRGVLSVGEAAGYVFQVCEALVEAHGQGIVHRDLKPPNLFLTRRPNGSPCIKVLDFGISKDVSEADKNSPKLTQTGSVMGSPQYMSPEQMVDSKNVDARCDIWAMGIILYELVTGTMPFHAETMPEIVAKVLSTQPLPPSQVRAGVTPAFDAVVARCIEKNRNNRFQSAQEFMTALKPFVNEGDERAAGPIQVIPRSVGEPSVIAPSAVSCGHANVQSIPAEMGKRAARSSGRIWMIAVIVGILVMFVVLVMVAMRPNGRDRDAIADVPSSAHVAAPATATAPASDTIATATVGDTAAPSASTSTDAIRSPAAVTTTIKTKKKVKGFDE